MQNADTRRTLCCPLNGKLCIEGRREDFHRDENDYPVQCRWWVHLFGKDPQSEKMLDQFDCAMAWLPVTTIETSQSARMGAASIDKLSNVLDETKRGVNSMLNRVANEFRQLQEKVENLNAIEVPPNGKLLDGPGGNNG